MRRAEISNLEINFIDKKNRRLYALGKGSKQRFIPLPPELFNDLCHFIKGIPQGKVFPSKIIFGAGIVPKQINVIVAQAGRRASIKNPDPNRKNINPHILRHSYARHLKDQGVKMETLRTILGHESIKTTMDTYGLQSVEDIEAEFENVKFE